MMMMGSRAAASGAGGSLRRCAPFTASQWEELENQALIYKFMSAGLPVPPELLHPLRRSFLLDSALATGYPPQASLRWGCFEIGFGRKAEDPEPGRCRRTDGKKWRCSKEAYPDSKYCEKHMHRGKNRSRKPVEMSLATPPSSAAVNAATTTTSSAAPAYHRHDAAPYHALYGGPYAAAPARYHHAQTTSPFHRHLDTTHPHPPASYYSSVDHKDYAYGHAAAKDAHGEHAFFSDRTEQRDHHAGQWQFKQLGVESKPSATQHFPAGGGGYGNAAAASPYSLDLPKEEDEQKERRQQHCFLLGADLRLDKPQGHDHSSAGEDHKPLRHFFDEWPHEKSGKGSWMGLEGETQLSISIPAMAANDLPITATSRYHHDG